ncbi:hypothetical protein [Bhargavaea changchunensis]|uniref:hypothetical protein n=1 Tax=Bhargavaea changchunensis TaxID=2134037 RepID=UPI003671DB1E
MGQFFFGAKVVDGRPAYPHHHEKFDFHEPALAMAARIFAGIFVEAQKQNCKKAKRLCAEHNLRL